MPLSVQPSSPASPPPTSPPPTPVSERRVYRADGGSGGEEPGGAGKTPVRSRTSLDAPRSRMVAAIVLVLVAIVIALAGVAAGGSALNGSQGDAGTFKLLPITTTTS